MPHKNPEVRRKFFRDRYAKNLKYVQELKIQSGCVVCGYDEHHAGLEFDHILPKKRGTVAQQMGKSLKVILEEIERCEIVCGTCHGVRTYERHRQVYGRGHKKD